MIRKLKAEDIDAVMNIWLESNINTHYFVPKDHWARNLPMVSRVLPQADVYVYEDRNEISGFVGMDGGYIAGLFVQDKMRGKGIGKLLLQKCKELHSALQLCVYTKNSRAVRFYLREGFLIEEERRDENTGEMEYRMQWRP